MPAGYVYVLENETIPGLVKIGSTERNPDDRAKELMTTGVPALFKVVYSRYVFDCKLAEELVHKALGEQRKNNDREFFAVSVAEAIEVIEAITAEEDNGTVDKEHAFYLGRNIYSQIKLPGYDEKIDEAAAEKLEIRLKEAAQLGYYPALHTLSEIYMRNYLNSSRFRTYYQDYLRASREAGGDGFELGKSIATYIECLVEMKRLMDSDFSFVQKFLISGNQHTYHGFVDNVNRFLTGDIKSRCLNL